MEDRNESHRSRRYLIMVIGCTLILAGLVMISLSHPAAFLRYRDCAAMEGAGEYLSAAEGFEELGDYLDSESRALRCRYKHAGALLEDGKFDEAEAAFTALASYEDSAEKAMLCIYSKACSLMDSGDYSEASAVFATLGDYSDSREKIQECAYLRALVLFDEKKYSEAQELFLSAGDYMYAPQMVDECSYRQALLLLASGDYAEAEEGFTALAGYKNSKLYAIKACIGSKSKGETVPLGMYPQGAKESPEEQPIEWYVLGIENGKALLLSRYSLWNGAFFGRGCSGWEDSPLREALNGDFYIAAFSADEQLLISEVSHGELIDRVFLLSVEEVTEYIGSDKELLACRGSHGPCSWWLRSPADSSSKAAVIGKGDGYPSFIPATGADIGIRPAVWIDLGLLPEDAAD